MKIGSHIESRLAPDARFVRILGAELLSSLLVDAPASRTITLLGRVGSVQFAGSDLGHFRLRRRNRLECLSTIGQAGALLKVLLWLS